MQQTFKSSRIAPPAFKFVPGHFAPFNIGVVYVGDFQFAAARWLECAYDFKNARVVHVNSDHGILGLWLQRLFFYLQYAPAVEFRDAKALRIGNALQEDFRAFVLSAIRIGSRANVSLNNVVAEDDTNRPAAGEVLDQRQRRRDAALAFLISVIEVLQSECFSVSQQFQKVAGRVSAGNDHDVVDAGANQRLNRGKDHWW